MSILYQIKNWNTFLCGKTCHSQENQHKTTTQLCLGSGILTVQKEQTKFIFCWLYSDPIILILNLAWKTPYEGHGTFMLLLLRWL